VTTSHFPQSGVATSDEINGGESLEFYALHRVKGDPGYMVHSCKSGVISGDFFANPVPCLNAVNIGCGIPWDIHYDDFSVIHVGGVVGHPKGLEAFPCFALQVPKIFDSSATKIGNGTSFTKTTYS
jgi:hypothetical protein